MTIFPILLVSLYVTLAMALVMLVLTVVTGILTIRHENRMWQLEERWRQIGQSAKDLAKDLVNLPKN